MSIESTIQDIYAGMVGGSFPVGEGMDVLSTLRMTASEVLATERVHFLYTVEEGTVFYLAVPSASLASARDFHTPLASGLPGAAGHQGDGVYMLQLGAQSAALIRQGRSLRLLMGYAEEVRDSVNIEGASFFDVEDIYSKRMISGPWFYKSLVTRGANIAAFFSMGLIGLSAVVFLGGTAVTGYMNAGLKVTPQKLAAEANEVIASARVSHPLSDQMSRVSAISAAVVKTGGWIDGYTYSAAKGEAFTVSLPTWTTADTIKDLGEGVKTELQASGANLLWARKPDKLGAYIKDLGPQQFTAGAARKKP